MPMTTLVQPGAPIAPVAIAANRLTVGDITVDFAAEQQDTAAEIVIHHHAGAFVRGGDQGAIVAIVRIPARRYTEQQGDADPITGAPTTTRVAEPLNPNAVSVELWPFAG
jgi:hypothetical protein